MVEDEATRQPGWIMKAVNLTAAVAVAAVAVFMTVIRWLLVFGCGFQKSVELDMKQEVIEPEIVI